MTNSMRSAAIMLLAAASAAAWSAGGAGAVVAAGPAGAVAAAPARPQAGTDDPRLKSAHRFERGGWIYVHLEGTPAAIGYQHGYLLGPEIQDAFGAVSLNMTHGSGRDWAFYRKAAEDMLWPKIEPEYRQELQGIVDGLRARTGSTLDVYDLVAYNAFEELPDYYVPWLDKQRRSRRRRTSRAPATAARSSRPAAGRRTAASSWPTTRGPTT